MEAITYDQLGTIKNEVINLDIFENIVNKLESTTETTADLKNLSPKYEKLRNNRETEKQIAEAENIDFKNLA